MDLMNFVPFNTNIQHIDRLTSFYICTIAVLPILYCIDQIMTKLFMFLKKTTCVPYNFRWFGIHCIINCFIAYFCIDDIMACLNDMGLCGHNEWIHGDMLYVVATALHFYHMLRFPLTATDILHHGMSAVISSPLIITLDRSHASIVALFFLCGFPGAIDYFLLSLVKLNIVDKETEKKIYNDISMWLRSPGCVASCVLHIGMMFSTYSIAKQLALCWLIFITYVNGIFFAQLTIKDYYKNKSFDRIRSNLIRSDPIDK